MLEELISPPLLNELSSTLLAVEGMYYHLSSCLLCSITIIILTRFFRPFPLYRTFSTVSGLNGNILAPNNIVRQTNGVTKGLIIAGDMPVALHSRNPNCIKFDPVTITGRTAGTIQVKPSRVSISLLIPLSIYLSLFLSFE